MASITITRVGLGNVVATPNVIFVPTINCFATCTTFDVAAPPPPWQLELTATPSPGFMFTGWIVTSGTILEISPLNSTSATQIFTLLNSDFQYEINATFQPCSPITFTPTGPFNYTVGIPFGPVTLIPSGGTGPYTFTTLIDWGCGQGQFSGDLPPGITLDPNTGVLSGTPTGLAFDIFIAIRVTDANQCSTVTCVQMIPVSNPCTPITLENSGPFSIFLNELIDPITLVPVGGTGPYSFNLSPNWDGCPGGICLGATLPPGLTIGASTGIISGTPTAGSPCTYVPIQITDSNQCVSVVCIQISSSVRPLPPCYLLTQCPSDVEPAPIIVTNDLSQYVGQVIQILGECFEVTLSQSCVGAVTLNNPVITAFADCCSCNPPKVYELIDCTLQTPAIITTTPLASYVGQTIKVCEFISSPVIQIDGIPLSCGLNELGFVTQITGPTSGTYYDGISNTIKPYINPLTFPVSVGDQICVNPLAPFDVVSYNGGTYLIQFFIGTTAITNQITVNSGMPIPTLQWFIDNQITYTNTTIIVNTFDTFNHLNVTITISEPITETQTNVIVTFPGTVYPPTVTVTDDILGQCICYTVNDLGTSCISYPPFTGVISGSFPDCVCCNPPPEPEPPVYEPTIPEIDKHTYRVPESQCDIDANIVFAAMTYDQYKQDQYGMQSCCPFNINKIWIGKELSDLSKINC